MAYAALASLAQTIDQILNHDQYSISLPQKQQIIFLYEQTVFLQAFLEDFPEEAKSLEGRMRDVANEAEDIIAYFMWKFKQTQSRNRLIKLIARPAKFMIKEQLEKVTEEIESIAGEVMDIKNSFRMKDVKQSYFSAASSSSRLASTGKNGMVGFGDELLEIKTRLCGESSKLLAVPILGMGGIGKTTLAINIYDDPLIIEHFHVRAWVTVSQKYSAQEILSSLLVFLGEFNRERCGKSNESMEENVYKSLRGRRYLIVMDDIWSTNVWDDLMMIFPDDNNGSRIMLTTRLSDVAAYASSSGPIYGMRFMDEDQSWTLLRQKVFMHQDCPPKLEKIGQEIAKSCRGLPLAIAVIAGLLSTVNKTQASWEKIAGNVNSAVVTKDGQFEKILSLSYNHLPHHLRPCFLYMGGFPEDYEIHASKLIKLWIAEGFIKPNPSKTYEEAAEEYLEDLVKRSLVLVMKRKSNGKIKSCNVHDLVWNSCIRKAQEEKFLLQVMNRYVDKFHPENIKGQRRIAHDHSKFGSLAKTHGSTIRTIICFQRRGTVNLKSFPSLKVLNVVNPNVSLHPNQVSKLFHLRYLALSYPGAISSAISNLQNLQTLVIHQKITSGHYLTPEIWRLPQLRHLVSPSLGKLPKPKKGIHCLENLQTLSVANNFMFTKRMRKMIPNLKKLGVSYTPKKHIQHLHNLVHLHQLEILELRIYPGFPSRRKVDIGFPRTLKKLTLSGWRIPWKDMTMVGSLPNLQVLKLRDSACHGSKWRTTEGEFPQLKFMQIDLSDLQHWITESSHFPSLKCLLLHHCRRLRKIPRGIGEIPTLELIEVKFCCRSLVKSAKRIQEEQQSCGNNALQVRCMHSDGAFRTIIRTVVSLTGTRLSSL